MNTDAAAGTPHAPGNEAGPAERERAGLTAALADAKRDASRLSEQCGRYWDALIDSGDRRIAAEKRAKRAEDLIDKMVGSQEFFARLTDAERERDGLAAVVEKVRQWAEEATGYGEPSGDTVSDLLAAAPADALREHDAELIDELADEAGAHDEESGVMDWLREKACQRREERDDAR